MVHISKIIRKLMGLVGSKKMVIFRKETGLNPKIDYEAPADNSTIEYVVYDSSLELSAEDSTAINKIAKGAGKKILKWLDRSRYRLYAIKLDGELVHFGLVVVCKKGGSYGMAGKDDLMIMTCNTLQEYRKQGFYKGNLEYICSNWTPSKWAYIHTRTDNIPSQKGVEAAGFQRMGTYKCFRIGRFAMCVKKCGY